MKEKTCAPKTCNRKAMNKEYFSHDISTRADDKIKALIRRHKMTGYGVFWAIVEDLYSNANVLRIDCDGIADDLRCESEVVRSIIYDFNLFKVNEDRKIFSSDTVKERLKLRKDKSLKASESANKRWNKDDANALPTQSEGNAKKERKVKESKVNKSKVNTTGIENPFSQDFLEKVWSKYLQLFSEAKKKFPTITQNTQLKKLFEYSKGDEVLAEKIVNQSISKPWFSLWPLEKERNQNGFNGNYPKSESQKIHDAVNNGVNFQSNPGTYVEVTGTGFKGDLKINDEGLIVYWSAGKNHLVIDPKTNYTANRIYKLSPGVTIQDVHKTLLNYKK